MNNYAEVLGDENEMARHIECRNQHGQSKATSKKTRTRWSNPKTKAFFKEIIE